MKINDNPAASFATQDVAGIPFNVATVDSATKWLNRVAADRVPVNVRLANAYNVALADSDREYFSLLSTAGTNFPDGMPVVWFMRRRGAKSADRVRGPSLFVEAMRTSAGTPTRHFFLGSTENTLRHLLDEINTRYPGVRIVGSFSPPFSAIDERFVNECVERVREADPDIVWVGLGTPKQDVLGTRLSEIVRIPTVNVGAAFDFVAGTVREAPPWVQRSGFEWLYRFASEPRRLWRRYLLGNARFLRVATFGRRAETQEHGK